MKYPSLPQSINLGMACSVACVSLSVYHVLATLWNYASEQMDFYILPLDTFGLIASSSESSSDVAGSYIRKRSKLSTVVREYEAGAAMPIFRSPNDKFPSANSKTVTLQDSLHIVSSTSRVWLICCESHCRM